jgi:thiamine biosynthesis lipoprotein
MSVAGRLSLAAIWLLSWCGFAKSEDDLKRFSKSELHMGVEFEVVLYAQDEAAGEAAIDKVMARIAELDKTLSDYDLDSELSKLSETSVIANGKSGPFPAINVGDDLWTVLVESQAISRQTEGAFDVTIGPLSKLWRRARRWKELPEADALAAAQASVGYRFLQLDPAERTARLTHPNMRLDLGGIAKGYAADEGVKAAVEAGVSRVLVRASGDIAAGEPPPGKRGWRLGIAPLNPDEPPQRFVEISNCGISTSGDARQHLVVNGRRYSHIIDPRTGECVSGRSSVTVIAPRGIVADGVDTAVSVLGPEKALSVCERFPGIELLMVYESESGEQHVVESSGFRRYEAPLAAQSK